MKSILIDARYNLKSGDVFSLIKRYEDNVLSISTVLVNGNKTLSSLAESYSYSVLICDQKLIRQLPLNDSTLKVQLSYLFLYR